ncbi:hypothetical protein D3C86_2126940 [compost metagenome]
MKLDSVFLSHVAQHTIDTFSCRANHIRHFGIADFVINMDMFTARDTIGIA